MSGELSEISKLELIKALLDEQKKRRFIDKESIIGRLKKLHKAYTEEQEPFNTGDLVVWKDGMRNKKMPPEGIPAIVIRQLTEPVIAKTDESGSAYFREPLDLIAGFIDDDGDFVIFHFDSRRFKKYDEE